MHKKPEYRKFVCCRDGINRNEWLAMVIFFRRKETHNKRSGRNKMEKQMQIRQATRYSAMHIQSTSTEGLRNSKKANKRIKNLFDKKF